jgi:hypothetical protein
MVDTNHAFVNARRTGGVDRFGFDLDLTTNGSASRKPTVSVVVGDVIDLWEDAATVAERRPLASRGDAFAEREETKPAERKEANCAERNEEICCASNSPVNHRRTFNKPFQFDSNRETCRRYDLKHAVVRMLRTGLSEDDRSFAVCGCGVAAYDRDQSDGERREVTIHRNDVRAWVSGVYRCKSGWLCPTCAPAVARKRQQSVQDVVEATTSANGAFLMGLATVSHTKKDKLADLKKLVTESFAAARRQKNWARAEIAAGVAGVLVAPEVTYGKHGWHFHLHFGIACLPFTEGDGDEITDVESERREDAALAAGHTLIANFRAQVASRGGKTVEDGQGIQIAASGEAAADYIAKGTSWELAGGTAHKSDATGQTIWEVVSDADAGDIVAFARFKEYAEVMPGTRSCVVTAKMRSRLRLPADVESGDGEQLFEDGGKIVGHVLSHVWYRFLRAKLAGTFLSRIELTSGDISPEAFERFVSETTDAADRQEGVITLKRVKKIQKSAADVAAAHAATKIMLTRNIACRIRRAQALGKVHELIARQIDIIRTEGHPEAALPTPTGVVAELARLGRQAADREIALSKMMRAA